MTAALARLNRLIVLLASAALIVASLVLTFSVVVRYLLQWPTYWQDEAAMFLLVGATFLSSAWIQEARGHVAIEAISGLLPEPVNRWRRPLVDLLSLAFCGFFAWKSWTLWHEAWAEGQLSPSIWAPPMWIPYSTMAVGMTLLALQLALQLAGGMRRA